MQTYLEVFGRLPTMLTRRLILRPVRMSNAQDLYEYSRDPEVARHVLWDAHRSIHQTRAYIRYLLRQYRSCAPGTFVIALRDTGKVIGTIGFMGPDRKPLRRGGLQPQPRLLEPRLHDRGADLRAGIWIHPPQPQPHRSPA